MNKRLKRNITLDYLYCFTNNFNLTNAIWVLYMGYRGIPLWQIGILEGVYHFTSLLFEVPSGAAADLMGRKNVLIAGRVCSAIYAIIMMFSRNFISFMIAFIICAWGNNFNSGSEEALVYDSLKMLSKEKEYRTINARLNVIIEVAQGIATLIGGVLSEYSYFYCYLVSVLVIGISMIPTLLFYEPVKIKKEKRIKISSRIKTHFISSYQMIRENKRIRTILFYYSTIFTFYTVVYFYAQTYFQSYGINKVQISLIMLVASICACLGALSCEWLIKQFGDKTKYLIAILMAVGIMALFVNNLLFAIICFALTSYTNSVLYPIQSEALNQLIPSEQRATILSVDSMCFSIFMIIAFPLAGIMAEELGLHIVFLCLGIVELLVVLMSFKK